MQSIKSQQEVETERGNGGERVCHFNPEEVQSQDEQYWSEILGEYVSDCFNSLEVIFNLFETLYLLRLSYFLVNFGKNGKLALNGS